MRLKLFIVFAILLCLAGCSSIDGPPWVPSKSEIVKSVFPREDADNYAPPIEVKTIDVYLDISASMSGYVFSDGSSVYSKVLRALSTSFQSLGKVNFYKFGEDIRPMGEREIWLVQNSKDMYNHKWTVFSKTISKILEKEPKDKLCAIITDGVQSFEGEGYNLSRVIKSLAKGTEKGWATEIIGFRSQFSGTIYSEQNQSVKFWYASNGKPQSFRPFYLFVFGPHTKSLRDFDEFLVKSTELKYQRFSPIDSLINGSVIKYTKFEPLVLWKRDEILKGNIPLLYLYRAMRERLKIEFVPVESTINLKTASSTLTHKSKLNYSVRLKYNEGGASWKELPADEYILEPRLGLSLASGGLSFSALWNFRVQKKAGWYIYHIQYSPKEGSLYVPQWVENWSTEKDTAPEFANKTLYLSDLVRLLLNEITVKQKVYEHYIAIYWR